MDSNRLVGGRKHRVRLSRSEVFEDAICGGIKVDN